MRRARGIAGIGVVVGLPLVVIRTLHGMAGHPWFRVDWADFGDWIGATGLVDAITALSRPVALAVAYWSLIGTVVYLIAVLTGSERLVTTMAPFTLPVVRRLADRVVAGSIAVGVIATPLLGTPRSLSAEPEGMGPAPVAADYPPPAIAASSRSNPQPGPQPQPPPEPVSITPRPVTSTVAEAPGQPVRAGITSSPVTGPVVVAVSAGDHLWALAERRLGEVLGRSPSDPEIAPYWRVVVEQNRARLRSGDPDLVQPGEVILLPDPAGLIRRGN